MAINWYNPNMTGPSAPVPYVATASTTHSYPGYYPWVTFNENIIASSVGDCWITAVGYTTGWLQLDCGSPRQVTDYRIRIRGYTAAGSAAYTAMAKNWTMQGSNNGVDFVVLDTRVNEVWVQGGQPYREFSFAKAETYRYYRINVTANNGDAQALVIGKMQFGLDPAKLSKSVIRNTTTGKIYTTDGVTLTELPNADYDTVKQNGIASNTKLTVANIPNFKTLVGLPFEVITYGAPGGATPNVTITENFEGQKTAQSLPIGLAGIENIVAVEIAATPEVKHVISMDGGFTWVKFDGTSWVQVANFSEGNTTGEINAVTSAQYKLLYNNQSSITFGHALSAESSITSVKLKVNLQGLTRLAPSTSYTQDFDQASKTITFNITKTGQYIVNYVDAAGGA